MGDDGERCVGEGEFAGSGVESLRGVGEDGEAALGTGGELQVGELLLEGGEGVEVDGAILEIGATDNLNATEARAIG